MPSSHFPYDAYLLLLALTLRGAYAYTWSFKEAPSQCGELTVIIAGNGSTPPFHILIAPFGPSPLPNGVETRPILDISFTGNQSSVQLPYPAGSQFVAMVSDASGFASGGTSVATMVANSNDSSCFNATSTVQFDFVFNISPLVTQVVQCKELRIWWDPTTVQGTPNFIGIIPGGQSYIIPEGSITTDPTDDTGVGFSWTPSLRAGTTFLLMGNDARGNGTGGVVSYVVALGNNVASCLSNNSPSSTPGSPAGGTAPTQSVIWPSGSAGRSTSSNAGAIAGGTVGGFAGALVLALLLVYVLRRRHRRNRPVGVIDEDDAGDSEYPAGAVRLNELLQYYKPTPLVLDSERYSLGPDSGSQGGYTPVETMYDSSVGESSSSGQGGGKRRKGALSATRVFNYVLHADAGPSAPVELETIEMPPTYAELRRGKAEEGIP